MQPPKLHKIQNKIQKSQYQKLIKEYIFERKDMLAAQDNIHKGSFLVTLGLGAAGGFSWLCEHSPEITAVAVVGMLVVQLLSKRHEEECSIDATPLCIRLEQNEPKLYSLLNGLSYEQIKDLKQQLNIKRDQ